MADKNYSFAKDVANWLRLIITNEKWFRDDAPIWNQAQTSSSAAAQRQALIKALRRKPKDPRVRLLISRLKSCKPLRRCHSAACPECTRALQRYFVAQVKRSRLAFVCLSLFADAIPVRQLHTLDIHAFHLRVRRLLLQSGIKFAVGGVDYSFNTHDQNAYSDHWAVHLWLLAPAFLKIRNVALRQRFPSTLQAPRPFVIKTFDGNLRGAAYAVKNTFWRRLSYFQKSKGRRNTRHLKLRLAEKRELASHLNKSGLGSRLFVLGAERNALPPQVLSQLRQSSSQLRASLAASRRTLGKAKRLIRDNQ